MRCGLLRKCEDLFQKIEIKKDYENEKNDKKFNVFHIPISSSIHHEQSINSLTTDRAHGVAWISAGLYFLLDHLPPRMKPRCSTKP